MAQIAGQWHAFIPLLLANTAGLAAMRGGGGGGARCLMFELRLRQCPTAAAAGPYTAAGLPSASASASAVAVAVVSQAGASLAAVAPVAAPSCTTSSTTTAAALGAQCRPVCCFEGHRSRTVIDLLPKGVYMPSS